MENEAKRWDSFIKQNPKIKIEIQSKYLHQNRELVSAKYLEKLWGVTSRTIRNYTKEGMPTSELSSSRFKVFDLIDCITWRMSQIDMTKSNVSKVQQKESETADAEDSVFKANRDKIIADAKKAQHEANVAEIKEKSLLQELISADDVDKAMAEQAVIHKTDIINSEKILPLSLENQDRASIATALREHNEQRLEDLNNLISKEFDCEESLYEIVDEVIKNLNKYEPKEIIEKLRS